MNKYETIFLIKDDITEEQRNEVVSEIRKYLEKNGKVSEEENLGKKKLAYEVKKQKEGYYQVFNFEANPELIKELERNYRITDEIIKFMTIKVDE